MIKLDQKADVLMKYFRENKSQRAIAKEMKISRTAVRKYIKDYESRSEIVEELAKSNDAAQNDIVLVLFLPRNVLESSLSAWTNR